MKKTPFGFSLVEVTIALGIIAFCVVSVFGLLPVALKSTKDAGDRRAAVEILNKLAGDVVNLSGAKGNYNPTGTAPDLSLSGAYSNVSLETASRTLFFENAEGERVPKNEALYGGVIEIIPTDSAGIQPGMAKITVGWPASVINTDTPDTWANTQGTVRTVVYFNQ